MAPDDAQDTQDLKVGEKGLYAPIEPPKAQDPTMDGEAPEIPSTARHAAPESFDTIQTPGGDDAEALIALKNLEKRRREKKRQQRLKIAGGIALVALIAGFFGLRSLFSRSEPEGDMGPQVAFVERRDFETSVQGSGALKPIDSVVVTPEIDGIIDTVNVSEGQRVNVGEVLFTIRNSELDKAINDAAERVASAQGDLSEVYDSVSRLEAALAADRSAYEAAAAQAAIDTARANEAYEQAYAAYDGLIIELQTAVYSAEDKARVADAKQLQAQDEWLAAKEAGAEDEEVLRLAYETATTEAEAAHRNLEAAQQSLVDCQAAAVNAGKEAAAAIPITPVPDFSESAAQAQIESARMSISSAEEAVTAAQKAYNTAVETAEKRTVRSPRSGTIVSVGAQSGAAIGVGASAASPLVQIADVSKMKVSVEVNEIDISEIKVDSRARCTFSAIPDLVLEGKVTSVASVASGSGGGEMGGYGGVVTFAVDVLIDKPDPRVKPGMTTNVVILTNDVPNALVIPAMALYEDGAHSYVDVVVDEATFATERREVKVGARNASEAVIESGLSEGEEIMLSGGMSMAMDEGAEGAEPAGEYSVAVTSEVEG